MTARSWPCLGSEFDHNRSGRLTVTWRNRNVKDLYEPARRQDLTPRRVEEHLALRPGHRLRRRLDHHCHRHDKEHDGKRYGLLSFEDVIVKLEFGAARV